MEDISLPFDITFILEGLLLHNGMLDSGAATNVMPLTSVSALGLEITRPYGNVCGIDSKEIKVHGPL